MNNAYGGGVCNVYVCAFALKQWKRTPIVK